MTSGNSLACVIAQGATPCRLLNTTSAVAHGLINGWLMGFLIEPLAVSRARMSLGAMNA